MTKTDRIVEDMYRAQSRAVFATLIRLLGDFDLAEDGMHDAFAAAAETWRGGLPDNPFAWLVSTGRFKAIDRLRRRVRFDANATEIADRLHPDGGLVEIGERAMIEDDMLRLVFTCCHPALPPAAQLAMALREVCGLTTEEIARAFLTTPPTIAQRIVRAKAKIRAEKLPYEIPDPAEMQARLESVLQTIYLLFNEGYSASAGAEMIRATLSDEAIRLGRLVARLLPDPEVDGLLALMLLQHSRRHARLSSAGELVLLVDQDRSLWDRDAIAEGTALSAKAMAGAEVGAYAIQSAIAAVHANAATAVTTDWRQIVDLYDLLLVASPSPVVAMNRAIAVASRDGPAEGLALVDAILAAGNLSTYHLAHATRADFLRRLGLTEEALAAYEKALGLATLEQEKAFLRGRMASLTSN